MKDVLLGKEIYLHHLQNVGWLFFAGISYCANCTYHPQFQLVNAFKNVRRTDDIINEFFDAEDKECANSYKLFHWGPISAAIVTMMVNI